jgi:hypothetical protein
MCNERYVKTAALGAILTASFLSVGCNKKGSPPSSTPSTAGPVAQPVMTAWKQGDKTTAIRSFVETDWSIRPLFPSSSTLSLSEEQFNGLPAAERQAKSGEMMLQLDSLKQLAAAVAQAGRDATSKGDIPQTRKYFSLLKQCGTGLDSPDDLRLVQLFGQAFKKMGDTESAKIPQ